MAELEKPAKRPADDFVVTHADETGFDGGLREFFDYRDLGMAGVSGGKVQAKIRNAQLELVNYMAVVGPKEAEAGQLALRDRIDGDLGSMPVAEAVARLKKEIGERQVRQVVKSSVDASAVAAVDSEAVGNEY